ncbi:hypothetical protein CSC94_01065 [Zhengella mangrovi]|uniref:DUF1402 domain-containing protein n=1 Tax=Zhengella mangrovi TaxID=1982044 RepID=A0A2G1QVA8_9HYPH|nr:DUF1402 family protein [Zhengella mangrovi]PHP69138.1 hypothetical protein CSC94_01065 [Zhengella mangrovi]
MFRRSAFALCLALAFSGPLRAQDVTAVPPGNRHAEQPAIPGASAKRTQALKTTFDRKYQKVFDLLKSDTDLRGKISAEAKAYGIDPMHIVGAIVGEHTYNVDAYDRLQSYYIKALSYVNSRFQFEYDGEDVSEFIARPEFSRCTALTGSYDQWTCRETVWNTTFRGKTVSGKAWPNDRFSAVFFQPFYAGQTFGLGQLNPLTALEMSDLVHDVSGYPRLDHRNPQAVYRTIMDPDMSLAYVAAVIRKSIDAYRTIAGYDISNNPGVTATLYNLGNPEERAMALKDENAKLVAEGKPPRMPEENYYGWLVNDKLAELKALF